MTNVLYSGGADGADSVCALCAKHRGDEIIAFSFHGHKKIDHGRHELDDGQLEEHLESTSTASKGLKRQVGRKPSPHPRFRYIRSLILRNAWQVWGTEEYGQTQAVYAIASLDKFHRQVEGGTAWAVEIALHQTEIPVYVFDLKSEKWYTWADDKFHSTELPPAPSGVYTGIGSRKLSDVAIEAVGHLYRLPISPFED